MRSILTIDIGNSRVKANLYEDGECVLSLRETEPDSQFLSKLLREHRINGVIYTSVGRTEKINEGLFRASGIKVVRLTADTELPINVDYKTRGTLGTDRIAAVVGALALYPGKRMLVADAGTAITMDVADPERGFCGGNISAGVSMRLASLHHYTARLPEVTTNGDIPIAGYDTVTALRSGAVRGAAAEIASMAKMTDSDSILLTGGDCRLLEKYVKDTTGICCTVVPDLVECGLLRIYEYNEDNM